MPDRVSVPGRVRIARKRTPIGPNASPLVLALPKLEDAPGGLHELHRQRHEHDARKSHRIALQNRIVSAGDGSASVSGFLEVESGLRPGGHRGHIFFWRCAFRAAEALILPDARKIA